VGIVYAQQGEIFARRLGLKIISPKIPSIVDQILELRKQDTNLVVHCWRGGLRSEAVASFLTIVGIDCWRLTGGYKAWRRYVLEDFARDNYPFTAVVLHGRTGTGKTDILAELKTRGAQVLDLEALSGHRGSFFGALGLSPQPTQKNFEGALWEQLSSFGTGPVFIEAESRKLGRVTLPDFVMRKIEGGRKILVTAAIANRVERLLACYMPEENCTVVGEALEQLRALTDALGKQTIVELEDLAAEGHYHRLVALLLERYYDPHYDKHTAKQEPFAFTVCGENSFEAAEKIMLWCQTFF
jgi:tRNA 2-selenouridine synthase